MRKQISLFFILISIFAFTSCTYDKVEFNKEAKYVGIHKMKPGYPLFGRNNILSFYDANGKFLESYKFKVDIYLSKGTDQYIFFYGKTGILRVDKKNKIAEKITDVSSDVIDFEKGKLYHNVDNGFVNYPHPKYNEKICEFNGDCLSLNNYSMFKFANGKIYMHLNQYDEKTLKQWFVLRVYDFKTKEILSEEPVSHLVSVEKANDRIYIFDENHRIYDFETKEVVFDLKKYEEEHNVEDCHIELGLENNYKGELVIRIRKNGDLVLYNITTGKEDFVVPNSINLNFSSNSKIVVSENEGEPSFTDLSTNQTFKLKNHGNDYISSYVYSLD